MNTHKSERLELRLSPEDVAALDELRRMAGFPTPSKADVVREALAELLRKRKGREGKR